MAALLADDRTRRGRTATTIKAPAAGAAPWRRLLPRRDAPLLGLDIGSSTVKAVVLRRRHGRVTLERAALVPTPPGVLTEGALTDPLALAERLKGLWKDMGAREKGVAAAIGGERVICQTDEPAPEQPQAAPEFVVEQAQLIGGFAPEASRTGFQPLGGNGACMWAAAAVELVDWVRQAVALSGRSPVSVEPQACALVNSYGFNYRPDDNDVRLLLNVGARHLTVALAKGWTISYGRDVLIAPDWLSPAESRPADRVVQGLERHWSSIVARALPSRPSAVLLAGGGGDPKTAAVIRDLTGLEVQKLHPFTRIGYSPASEPGALVAEQPELFAVAVGLALQSFPDL